MVVDLDVGDRSASERISGVRNCSPFVGNDVPAPEVS
jgi:hypothetical protein